MDEETLEVIAPEAIEEEAPEAEESESVEEIQARLAKAEELANNYKIRAEKAEKAQKQVQKAPEAPVSSDLSTKDTIALMNAKVNEDDIDEIVDFAKFKGISVSEALKTDVVKTILSTKAEQRTIAEATNTGTSRRSSAKVSDESLVANASAGKLPESDDEIERLLRAKLKTNQ